MSDAWVIDPGTRVTNVWSSTTGIASHPSLVAIDGRGVIFSHGVAAVDLTDRRHDGLSPGRPFRDGDVADETLARAFLRWMLTGAGQIMRSRAILFPLPTSTSDEVASHWKYLARAVGGRPVIADRPTAVALGLGLSVETERAHLLIEVTSDFVEIGIVSRGAVIAEHLIRGEPESWGLLVDLVRSMLLGLDPDDELDIREEGLHLVASEPQSQLLARLLADGVGVPVLITDAETHPVLLGASQMFIAGRLWPRPTLSRAWL